MTRKKLLNAVLVAALGVGMSAIGTSAHDWGQGPPKYLIAWMSDQYMDGRNASPLDGILGLPSGALPDADFLAVLEIAIRSCRVRFFLLRECDAAGNTRS